MHSQCTTTAIIALVVRIERRTRTRVSNVCYQFVLMQTKPFNNTIHKLSAEHQQQHTTLRLTYTVLYAKSMSFVSPIVYDNSLNSREDNDNARQHHHQHQHQHHTHQQQQQLQQQHQQQQQQHTHTHGGHRRGRRRKEDRKHLDESLKEKVNAALRIHKLKTTQELAQQFNIELQSSSPLNDSSHSQSSLTVERIASSLSSKSQSHAYSYPHSHSHPHYAFTSSANCDAFADETKTSKSELMHRFLSSTSSANANQHNIDDSNDNIDIGIDHTQHNHEHYSNYSNYYRNDGTDSQCYQSTAKTKSIDSVGDEIRDILSQLPPLNLSEIAWSDSDLNETNDDINDNNKCVDDQQTARCEPEVSEARVAKLNGDYKWEYVNGTYDSETDWKDWHQMTSAVSYNGDLLHILPYVNIKD